MNTVPLSVSTGFSPAAEHFKVLRMQGACVTAYQANGQRCGVQEPVVPPLLGTTHVPPESSGLVGAKILPPDHPDMPDA